MNFYEVFLTVGKEKQLRITDKWIWYFGGDVVPGLGNTNTRYYTSGDLTQTNISTTFSMAARPFVGARFNISPRLYLSTEFSINVLFNDGRVSQETVNPYLYQEVKSNSFQLRHSSFRNLFLLSILGLPA